MIKLLAKLRQYKDGDIAEYLRTEHRQNLIALERALDQRLETTTATVEEVAPAVTPGMDVFYASVTGSFSGTVPISSNYSIYAGSLSGNTYLPVADGDYWIEFSANLDQTGGSASGGAPSTLSCPFISATGNYVFNVDSSTNFITRDIPVLRVKASLLASTGISFTASPAAGCSFTQFYCKITKA